MAATCSRCSVILHSFPEADDAEVDPERCRYRTLTVRTVHLRPVQPPLSSGGDSVFTRLLCRLRIIRRAARARRRLRAHWSTVLSATGRRCLAARAGTAQEARCG